jgi:t-SNARE complex subunit (syntaxin)
MGKIKTVLVANDQAAMTAIDYDTERPDQIIKLELTADELDYLFTSGLVDEINEVCEAMIDDFEDDMITSHPKLRAGLTTLESYQNRNTRYSAFVGNLINLFKEALARDTAIYFYF